MKYIPKICSIDTRQFSINANDLKDLKNVLVSLNMNFGVNESRSTIASKGLFLYSVDDCELMRLEVECKFSLNPEDSEEINATRRVSIDALQYLASIVVGTARGIIHAKTAGTALAGMVLPQIDLTSVIKGDFVID